MSGSSVDDSGLRNGNGLTWPDYFQRAVPLPQPGNADMVTMRDTGQGFTLAHDVSDGAGKIIRGKLHIERLELAI